MQQLLGNIMPQALAIIFATIFFYFFEMFSYKHIMLKLQKSKHVWDKAFFESLHRPLVVLILVLGLSFLVDVFGVGSQRMPYFFITTISSVRQLSVVVILVWFLTRFINASEVVLTKPKKGVKKFDETATRALLQVARLLVVIVGVLIVLSTLGFKLAGILTLGGVGGLVAGFAAKDLLSNFFGGLMLYLDKPFKVGDSIRSPDRDIQGTVEYIGWRLCCIRTFDKRPLYVPNSIFSTVSVENISRMQNRRISTVIGVRYQDATKLDGITKDVKQMLFDHPEIDTTATIIVCFSEFGISSLNFMVYAFTKTTQWIEFQTIQQDVFLKTIEIINKHGAEVAFPTSTMHIPEGVEVKN